MKFLDIENLKVLDVVEVAFDTEPLSEKEKQDLVNKVLTLKDVDFQTRVSFKRVIESPRTRRKVLGLTADGKIVKGVFLPELNG